MSLVETALLSQYEIKQLSKEKLVTLVLDFLGRLKKNAAQLSRETKLEKELNEANEQIHHMTEKIESLTKKLSWSQRRNEVLEIVKIPQLKREIENGRAHRSQLLSQQNLTRNKVKDLQTSLKNLQITSKMQVDKLEAKKNKVISEMSDYALKIDKYEREVRNLVCEVSRKINDISMKNNEILRQKEKTTLREGQIIVLEKQLTEAEKENTILNKKLSRTPLEEIIDKTKEEFEARLSLTSGVLLEEKLKNRTLVKRLLKKDREVNKLLKQQAESAKLLASQKQKEPVVKKGFEPSRSDWRKLKEENRCLSTEMEVLMENRARDQHKIKEVTEKVFQVRKKYFSEKVKHEELKESIKRNEAKIEEDTPLKEPTVKSKVEVQTNDEQVTFLPPILERTSQLPKKIILTLGEGKLEPDFKDDKLLTPEKFNQFKPAPPSKKKPETPSSRWSAWNLSLRGTEQRKGSGQPGGSAEKILNGHKRFN